MRREERPGAAVAPPPPPPAASSTSANTSANTSKSHLQTLISQRKAFKTTVTAPNVSAIHPGEDSVHDVAGTMTGSILDVMVDGGRSVGRNRSKTNASAMSGVSGVSCGRRKTISYRMDGRVGEDLPAEVPMTPRVVETNGGADELTFKPKIKELPVGIYGNGTPRKGVGGDSNTSTYMMSFEERATRAMREKVSAREGSDEGKAPLPLCETLLPLCSRCCPFTTFAY